MYQYMFERLLLRSWFRKIMTSRLRTKYNKTACFHQSKLLLLMNNVYLQIVIYLLISIITLQFIKEHFFNSWTRFINAKLERFFFFFFLVKFYQIQCYSYNNNLTMFAKCLLCCINSDLKNQIQISFIDSVTMPEKCYLVM